MYIGACFGLFATVQLVVTTVLMKCTRNGHVYERVISGVSIEVAVNLVQSVDFLDEDGDGNITPGELKRWMRRLGYEHLPDDTVCAHLHGLQKGREAWAAEQSGPAQATHDNHCCLLKFL